MIERIIISSLIFLALDAYVFKALLPYAQMLNNPARWISMLAYWLISVGAIAFLFYGMSIFRQTRNESHIAQYALALFFVFFIPKIAIALFHLVDDLFNLAGTTFTKLSSGDTDWSRRRFITQTGLGIGALLFGGALYGVTKGKFRWRVLSHDIPSKILPKAFDGFKVVQISDAHLGSFLRNYRPIEYMVEMINDLEPDLILFTGDMVNEHAQEAKGWEQVLGRLKAKHGKYSVYGNHDYGHYGPWDEAEALQSQLMLKEIQNEMGFQMLENENVTIEKDGETVKLLGVHNWGKSPHFPKIGDLDEALTGVSDNEFSILMSHDPTHFEEKIMGKVPIDLTLSGHTHGMQMGIEIPALGIKYSPIKHLYKRWGGLYDEQGQFLHVNRGMGVLGFPGRIGMWPEISLLTLRSA
ncbi:MAG: metallophosphoesterase [Flavobacteriales bacterium]|nr:metallophosphoesterase [Flavobacteriales bacterium]